MNDLGRSSLELQAVLLDAASKGVDLYQADGLYTFPQVWGSTALGFGGLGGQMITSAQTWVIQNDQNYLVYFGGCFAYEIHSKDRAKAREWLIQQRMPTVKEYLAS